MQDQHAENDAAPVPQAHHSHHLSSRDCPRCGLPLHRVHRRPIDRLFSVLVPVHRYKCSECGWRGLLRSHAGR